MKSTTYNKTVKRCYIETYGCQMNEYDTELVKSILEKEDYTFVDEETDADIIMLNTCAIREHAHRKIYGRVHKIHHDRNQRKGSQCSVVSDRNAEHRTQNTKPPIIGLLGCMATNLRSELLEDKGLNIDFIAGPDSYKRLPEMIEAAQQTDEKQFDLTLSEFETYSDVLPVRKPGVNAWVAVMRGCNNFCTFCVVPYTRGRERGRTVENVIEEVQHLADQGYKQVTLLGQNVNSYKHNNADFAKLLDEVSKVDGIKRIRFTSPHPKDFPESLLKVIAENPKVCKQIHLPLQSGNDRILELMNRTYTQKEFFNLVNKIRNLIPSVALSTDIIVGFSTETKSDFSDTIKIVKEVQFDSAFMFKYSERKQTIASREHPDDVSDEEKTRRIVELNELQKEISLKKNQAHVGEILKVLIEEEHTNRSDKHFQARTDSNKLVTFEACDKKRGDFIDVKITDASPHALRGEVTC